MTPQDMTINVLITDLRDVYLSKFFSMVDTRSNIQLVDLNSKPHGGKIIRYPPSGFEHHKHLYLYRFHGTTKLQVHSHDNPDKKLWSINCAELMKCIMCFITISQAKCTWGNILHIPTTKWEITARSYIYYTRLCIIQWMQNNHLFLLSNMHAKKHTTQKHA